MLKRSIIAGTVAMFGLGLAAQAQQSSPAQESSTPTAHFEGCVFPERALTADRAVVVPTGVTEDYILTDTKVISTADGSTEAEAMYKLEQIDQERMRTLIGKRVGVTGRIEDGASMPQFRVTAIREISGGCPTLPGRTT